ncbi:HDIG domain-containing protein [Candidatus Poribacteria bacterium]|nr:HDIG domain-containing protein [Candidatus Poribacteria bacterium]
MRMPWYGHRSDKSTRKYHGISEILFNRAKMHWWLLGVIFALNVFWTVFPMEEGRRLLSPDSFEVGEKSSRDIYAQADFTYYDETATEEEKQKALTELPPVFKLNFLWLENAKEEFKIVRQVRDSVALSNEEKVASMRRLFYIGPTDEVGLILATAPEEDIDAMERSVENILSSVLKDGIVSDGDGSSFASELKRIEYIKPKWNQIKRKLAAELGREPRDEQIASSIPVVLLDDTSTPPLERRVLVSDLRTWTEATRIVEEKAAELKEPISTVVREISIDLLRPNLTYDSALTEKRKKELLENFPPVSRRIPEGTKIIGAGDEVTEYHKGKLEAMYSVQKRRIFRSIPGAVLLTGLLVFVLVIYLRKYEYDTFSEPRKIIALNTVILLILALGNLIIVWGPALGITRAGFLIPAALASIIIAILVNVQLAIVVTCIIGIFIAMLAGLDLTVSLQYFLVILAGGITAAVSASLARHRRHLIFAGLYVSIVNIITIMGLGLLEHERLINIGVNCSIGAINGIAVAVLAPGLLPIFEYLSRTTTDMELLELSDLKQPLLIEFKEKASGSYHHSLAVAELADAAAEEIGANALLARVGSYYHDIGKIVKPEGFIENQKGENVHDSLSPQMSVRLISRHVKDGAKMGKEYKLPQVVVDIIQQHQGNTLIGGQRFYQKALEEDRHNTVRLEDFRYPGPKPQTKEAAIVMLADSVESARRAMLQDKPTYSRLVSFVREIIDDKIMDSQLDECDLTLRDISSIADAFVRVLSGMYHTRIDYPKEKVVAIGTESDSAKETDGDNDR